VRGQISTDKACVRVREGGEVGSDRIGPEPFACMLVGPDGRTMFIIAGEMARDRGVGRGARHSDRPGAVEPPRPRAGRP
jgi:hypothetical protein